MRRRQFIIASSAVAAGAAAGCIGLGTESTLEEADRTHDGTALTVRYEDDGEELVILTMSTFEQEADVQLLRTIVQQPSETFLDNGKLMFSSTETTANPHFYRPAQVQPYELQTFYREDGWAILDIEDFGIRGRSTETIDVLVRGDLNGDADEPAPLEVDYDFEVANNGIFEDTYRAHDLVEIDLHPS